MTPEVRRRLENVQELVTATERLVADALTGCDNDMLEIYIIGAHANLNVATRMARNLLKEIGSDD